ncbi:ATPase H(+)-transporting accessory protein 2-like isoform X2 [Macrosteles quadrilineatus]|uniref:ATPase H(+)-transporting accessory protein 2-like isoform X2 n=1 Tax=Macrosteles quadrilineatus TaxID=74068 RepID=UPI0023E2C521|nr:ATPase H(+)-transporting accessory protein 2-like isoform X2 [Macrosteles quadrilineatus]XP_054269687.1 ATPase H(+)-transporting accessory protein 2-like isoform X2 [Macrosteles quadrilineatus]
MKLVVILNVLFSVGVFGDGEVIIVSKSPNLEFRGHAECDSYIVKDILSTSLGFTTYPMSDWPGVYITSPFNFAESVVVIAVHGVASLPITDGHKFPYVADSPSDEIWATLESKILERYPYGENQSLVELNLEDDLRASEINLNKGSLKANRPTVKFLNEEEDDDSGFISQISTWRAVLDKVEEKGVPLDGLPDLYWLNLRGLHPIVDIYGDNSEAANEAKNMVVSAIDRTKEVFERAYNNKTLVLVLLSDAAHTRRFRRAADEAKLNLAPVYDENYPVFFNIFLWFTIAFIMSIIATSMVTACMDPGRDSIIYRMTSTRMKKDN